MLHRWIDRATGALLRSRPDLGLLRASLVLVFLGFGYTKWFEYEVQSLVPVISTSPFLAWLHAAFGIHGASYALGVVETATALLLVLGAVDARASVLGSLMAVATFAVTTSLLVTAGGTFHDEVGPPALGGLGAFLLKDVVLFAASVTLLRESLLALRAGGAPAQARPAAAG